MGVIWAQTKTIAGLNLLYRGEQQRGHGVIKFEMSRSTVSAVFRQPLSATPCIGWAPQRNNTEQGITIQTTSNTSYDRLRLCPARLRRCADGVPAGPAKTTILNDNNDHNDNESNNTTVFNNQHSHSFGAKTRWSRNMGILKRPMWGGSLTHAYAGRDEAIARDTVREVFLFETRPQT